MFSFAYMYSSSPFSSLVTIYLWLSSLDYYFPWLIWAGCVSFISCFKDTTFVLMYSFYSMAAFNLINIYVDYFNYFIVFTLAVVLFLTLKLKAWLIIFQPSFLIWLFNGIHFPSKNHFDSITHIWYVVF